MVSTFDTLWNILVLQKRNIFFCVVSLSHSRNFTLIYFIFTRISLKFHLIFRSWSSSLVIVINSNCLCRSVAFRCFTSSISLSFRFDEFSNSLCLVPPVLLSLIHGRRRVISGRSISRYQKKSMSWRPLTELQRISRARGRWRHEGVAAVPVCNQPSAVWRCDGRPSSATNITAHTRIVPSRSLAACV